MAQKETYSVCVLADTRRREDLIKKYSFIDQMDGGTFRRVEQDNNPDFFIIDLDMPFKPWDDLEFKIIENMEKCFTCRPIIFVNTERDQNDCSSKKNSDILPFIKNFCKTSIPCCKSINDLEKSLNWFRFIFKHDGSAESPIPEKERIIKQYNYSIYNITPAGEEIIKQLFEYMIDSQLNSVFRLR